MALKLPPCYLLHECIGITPAGIYCQETSIPLSISLKSIRDHMKKHHPTIRGKLENHLLNKIHSLVNLAKKDPDIHKYCLPDNVISSKWFCSKCDICFVSKRNAFRHIEGKAINCTIHDLSQRRCYQLICYRYYPVNTSKSSILFSDTSSKKDSSIYCKPTQEDLKEEDIIHIDYSQDFGDELPEIHMGKTDEITDVVQNYIGDDITPSIWSKILFAFIYSSCHLSLADSLEALKNPNITISKDTTLQVLLEAFQMMENNFTSVDAVLLRNLSTSMVKFTSKVGDDENDTPHSWGMREGY